MFIDPLTYLIAHRRAKDNDVDGREALKATLLGTAIGGGNVAVSTFFADRSIKQKKAVRVPVVKEPASCMDDLITAFDTFLACMEKDAANAKKLVEFKKAFRELCAQLVTDKANEEAIEKRLSAVFDKIVARPQPKAKTRSKP